MYVKLEANQQTYQPENTKKTFPAQKLIKIYPKFDKPKFLGFVIQHPQTKKEER